MTDRPRPPHARRAALLLGVVVALAPVPSTPQHVYRWVDTQGNVRYSGFPPPAGVATEAPAALPGPAARQGHEPIREQPPGVDEMLELAGLRAQLPGLIRDAVTHLVHSRADLSERERTTARTVAERAFDPARVYALLRDEYGRHSAPESRPAAAAWFRSPVGRRVVGLALEGARKADPATLPAFTAALERRPPSPGRLELTERLDWVTGSSGLSADLVLAIQGGLARGLARSVPPEHRLRPGQIDADVQERRPRVLTAIREPMRVRLLYIYRDLTDEDLRQYIEFAGSPAARAHNRALHHALAHAFRLTAERASTDLAHTVRRPPPRTTTAPIR